MSRKAIFDLLLQQIRRVSILGLAGKGEERERQVAVASVNDVKAALISSRRIIFTPASDLNVTANFLDLSKI